MPRKKKTNGDNPIGIGLTTKQMKRKKPISNTYLLDIEPITDNQKKLFDSYSEGKHLVAYGMLLVTRLDRRTDSCSKPVMRPILKPWRL